MWLSSDATAASGLMLQKVAAEGGKGTDPDFDPEDWNRVQKLAETVTPDEQLKLEPREVLSASSGRRIRRWEHPEPRNLSAAAHVTAWAA